MNEQGARGTGASGATPQQNREERGEQSPDRGTVQGTAEHLREAAKDQIGKARSQAASSREQAAERIRRVGSAVRQAGSGLREEEAFVADYAEKASQQIESFAAYVGGLEPGTLVRDVESLARRRPAVFFGGAFVLGLAAGRFLKSSRGNDDDLEFGADELPSGSSSSPDGADFTNRRPRKTPPRTPRSTSAGGVSPGTGSAPSTGVSTTAGSDRARNGLGFGNGGEP